MKNHPIKPGIVKNLVNDKKAELNTASHNKLSTTRPTTLNTISRFFNIMFFLLVNSHHPSRQQVI